MLVPQDVVTTAGIVRSFTGGANPEAGSPIVLLVHGSGGDATVWEPMLVHFSRVRAYAIDLPGRGASPSECLPSAKAYAGFLDQVRAGLGAERIFVVGQSLGGGIAQQYAFDFAPRCSGIVLANSALDFNISAQRLAAIGQDWEATAAAYARGQVSLRATPELFAAALRMVQARNPEVFRQDLVVCNGFDAKPWAHRITAPVLIVAGQDDTLTEPARSLAIYERIAHARMVTLAPCGHCTMLEQPALFAAAIEAFVAGTAAQASA